MDKMNQNWTIPIKNFAVEQTENKQLSFTQFRRGETLIIAVLHSLGWKNV